MKKFLLVILFIGFCGCIDEHAVKDVVESHWIEDPYNEDNIMRPCPGYDLKCIRSYFVKHARCTPRDGQVPDPFTLARSTLRMSGTNMTIILTDLRINGLNGNVVEFYVNKVSDVAFLAVEFQNLSVFSPAAIFKYYRKTLEPIVKVDFTDITYRSVTLSAIIPNIKDMQLAHADYNPYIDDSNPKYFVGPKASWSKDPVVMTSYAQFLTNLNGDVKIAFLAHTSIYMNQYIQNRICDFGLITISD